MISGQTILTKEDFLAGKLFFFLDKNDGVYRYNKNIKCLLEHEDWFCSVSSMSDKHFEISRRVFSRRIKLRVKFKNCFLSTSNIKS